MTNVQARKGWRGWGELAPNYDICSDCQPEVTYSMTQTGGGPTTFKLGGTKPYSDVLWSYPMVGPASVLDLPDPNKTLVPSTKNFIYDAYFFSSTIGAAQVLEFDVSQYFGGKSFIYGSQCRIAGGHAWDIWDNVNRHWVSAGIPCNPVNNDWNHVIVHFQRTSDNKVLLSVDHAQRRDPRHQPNLRSLYGPIRLVWHHRQVPDGRKQNANALLGQGGQVEPHVLVNITHRSPAVHLVLPSPSFHGWPRRVPPKRSLDGAPVSDFMCPKVIKIDTLSVL